MKNTNEQSVFEILDKIIDFGNKYKIGEMLCVCNGIKVSVCYKTDGKSDDSAFRREVGHFCSMHNLYIEFERVDNER